MTRSSTPLVALLAVLAGAGSARAIDSSWPSAASGEWAAAANWSTPSFPNNGSPSSGSRYNVSIDAVGAPYGVSLSNGGDTPTTLGRYAYVDSVTIDSPDATLRVTDNSSLTAYNGLHVAQGALVLDRGALRDTRLSAAPGGVLRGGPDSATFVNVTLAADFTAEGGFVVQGDLTLEDAVASFTEGAFYRGAEIGGTGEWLLASVAPDATTFYDTVYVYERLGEELGIGPGVTVRSTGDWVRILNYSYTWDTGGVVVNRGTILAETDGGSFFVEGFRNEGLIRVSGGDRFAAAFNGAVGEVQLGAGGAALLIEGAPHFDKPLVIGDGAIVTLEPNTVATADAGAPLVLQPGGQLSITPEAILPITATGGTLLLDHDYYIYPYTDHRRAYTLTEFQGLAAIAVDSLAFAGSAIDLEGGSLDLAALPSRVTFNPVWVENGTLTGATLPLGAQPFEFRNASLDIGLTLSAGQVVQLNQGSTLLQPMEIDGGRLELGADWSNVGGIVVNSGEVQLNGPALAAGSVQMNGGALVVQNDATLAGVVGSFQGAPDAIDIGRSTGDAPRGYLDLEGATLDLDAWPDTQWTLHSGRIENGTLVGTHEGRTLGIQPWGSLRNVDLDGIKLTGGNLGEGVFNNVWATGSVSTSGTLINSRVDGDLRFGNFNNNSFSGSVRGVLQAGGSIGGGVVFEAGASIVGSATLGGGSVTSRRVGDHFTFLDAAYTLPATVSIVSSTQYDSNNTFNANALTIEGAIRVGYDAFITDSWTDSITFNVNSLETRSDTAITEDGRLYVVGGPWTNAGDVHLTGGEIEAPTLVVTGAGTLSGWGNVTGNVTIAGHLATDNGDGPLWVTGSLTLGEDATTEVVLGARELGLASAPWINIIGDAAVDGDLSLVLSPGFLAEELEVGDLIPIAQATSITGIFDNVTWDLPWVELTPVYGPDTVQLEVTGLSGAPLLRGDGNGDGVVDAADYSVWRDHLGQSVDWFTQGDYDGSGFVDEADHAVWRASYGRLAAGVASVPEPGALGLALLAALSRTLRRAKRSS